MRIVKCAILSFVLMVSPPPCSPSPVPQQNPSAFPASTEYLADISVEKCGDPANNTKVHQVQKTQRGFPEARTPLDPLSVSPVKPKRDRPRRIKPSQKRRLASSPLDQVSQSDSLTPVGRIHCSSTTGQAQKCTSTNKQRLEPTKPSDTTDRTPSDYTRTRPFRGGSSRTGFGLPVDRIGLGRLPSGQRYF